MGYSIKNMKFQVSIFFVCILISSVVSIRTSPQDVRSLRASAALDAGAAVDGPITFENGKVGVNVAGFHAAAGVDAATGGLRAEAGGAGTGAAAGIGAAGAGASAGTFASGSTGASFGAAGSAYGHKTIHQQAQIVNEQRYTEAPKVVKEQTVQGAAQVQRTVIEKTVIPQYVEKTIQVPSYVEKTIRVPTVVEHKVRVPVTPKVVEKTYEEHGQGHAAAAAGHVGFVAHAGASVGSSASAGSRVMLEERPAANVQTQYNGYYGSQGNYGNAGGIHASGYAYKSGGLLGNILNIPIATLGAVGNLLTSFGSTGGSFAINKHISTY